MSKKIQEQAISLFENVASPKQISLTLNSYFEGIISGKWQDVVFKCRNIKDKSEQEKFKKFNVPGVRASGLFSGQADKDLIEHSGILVIDIDAKDQISTLSIPQIKDQLKEIPEILAIHYSLRGEGLAIYFHIKKDKHYESFEAISKMLANDYSLHCDPSCINVGRLRLVSYDPDLYLNYGAIVWNFFEPKDHRISTAEAPYTNFVFSENDITYILGQIKDRQLNIAPDYYSWLRIGFGLADKLGDGGRNAFLLISSYYSGKQKTDPNKQYDKCLKSRGTGITIKSFFYYAKLAGCNLTSERTKKIITIGKIRRKQEQTSGSGVIVNGKEDAKQYLIDFEAISGSDVDDILNQVWTIPSKELESEEGLLYDIELFLKSNYKFRLNEITGIVEVNIDNAPTPMNDYIFNSIQLKCKKIIPKSNKDMIFDVIHSEFTPIYNPIKLWFSENKGTNPTGNIKKLAECIQSDLTYKDATFIEYFIEKWLLSIIASAYGTYSILCLVLTGQVQGTGKSNFFRELLPEPLKWLFTTNKLDGKEADIGQLMCSKWLIMDDEFGGKSKQDEKRFKELISKQTFSIRRPYGRYFEDMRRLAVLCGTTNEEQVINDLTGNRRIIPIQINEIDEVKYNEIDKTELFIELYNKYQLSKKGWFLTKSDIKRLNDVCFDANQVSAECELPLKYFSKCSKNDPNALFISASEIRSIIEKDSGIRLSPQKLSIALKNIGYEYEQKQQNYIRVRGFWIKQKSQNYYNQNTDNQNDDDEKTHDKLPF